MIETEKSDPNRIMPNGEFFRDVRRWAWEDAGSEKERGEIMRRVKVLKREHHLTQWQAEDVVYGDVPLNTVMNARTPAGEVHGSSSGQTHGRVPWNNGGKKMVLGARSDFELVWSAMDVRIPRTKRHVPFTPRLYYLLQAIRKRPDLETYFYQHVISILASEHRKKLKLGTENTDEDRETLLDIISNAKVSGKSKTSES